jgi:hypothetical protein
MPPSSPSPGYRLLLVVVTAVTAADALPVLLRPARTPAGRRTERVRM